MSNYVKREYTSVLLEEKNNGQAGKIHNLLSLPEMSDPFDNNYVTSRDKMEQLS